MHASRNGALLPRLLALLAGIGLLVACQNPLGSGTSQAAAPATQAQERAAAIPQAPSAAMALASDAAYSWLKSQQDMTGNGLVDSLEDYWSADSPVQIVYTYDQAVAAIAFLMKGDVARARAVLDQMKGLQDADGSWINSYWWNLYGEEIRKHVGPVAWMALAVQSYEAVTGDTARYHDMAIKALDWCLSFQKPNGGVSGGRTTWFTTPANSWADEIWASTEHNEDVYAALRWFAATTPSKAAAYNAAADKVKAFLDTVMWDSAKNRFWGGYLYTTNAINPHVPLDVNPWGVMALGTSGTHNYADSIAYIENALANPGTSADNPRYVQNLPYNGGSINLYDFDWISDNSPGDPNNGGGVKGPDVWFEGSAFMSIAHAMLGNTTKADSIITEMIKKQGAEGSKAGGVPYSMLGTNNHYWKMSQQNCISSTGWLILAIHRWNPFTASVVGSTVLPASPVMDPPGGNFSSAPLVSLSSATAGAAIRYTLDGSVPGASSPLYSAPIQLSGSATLKAVAFAGGVASAVSSASYTVSQTQQLSLPVANPAGGSFSAPVSVSLSQAEGAALRYTLDGSEPTAASSLYGAPLTISATTTLKAKAFKAGWSDSAVLSCNYQIAGGADFAAALSISGASLSFSFDSYVNSAWVDLHYYTSKNGGQQNFRMLKSGSRWTFNATTSPALVGGDTVSYWFTYEKNQGALDSARLTGVAGGNLVVLASPSATPAPGSYAAAQTVSLLAESGATIRYTLDGSLPGPGSAVYSAPLVIASSTTIKAYASQSGKTDSAVAVLSYTIASSPVNPLVLDNFNSAQRWNSGTTSLGSAITKSGGIYNLEGDANLYFFYNGGANAEGFSLGVNRSLAGYTSLVLEIRGNAGDEAASLSLRLNDGSQHALGLAAYGSVGTAWTTIRVPLAAFGATLSGVQSLGVFGTGNGKVVRINEIRFE